MVRHKQSEVKNEAVSEEEVEDVINTTPEVENTPTEQSEVKNEAYKMFLKANPNHIPVAGEHLNFK